MGRAAAEGADVVVLTAEDPRRESLEAILDAVEAGARAAKTSALVTRVPDRGAALAYACRIARPGDTVVACGKGHEQSMCFGVTERPWDDRVGLRAAIAAAQL
jgi:UDP-N-acetylmuramoyl-L-alanyl-D-glutamate--2,6-diaminopimelate ligase